MALPFRPRPADMLDGMVDYLVDTLDGSVGILDGWERDEHGRPQALIVAQGWFGRRRFEIPVEMLVDIDHGGRRIVLARGAAPLEPKGLLRRHVELGQGRLVEKAAPAFPRSPERAPRATASRRTDHLPQGEKSAPLARSSSGAADGGRSVPFERRWFAG